jgi:hypothetical protein
MEASAATVELVEARFKSKETFATDLVGWQRVRRIRQSVLNRLQLEAALPDFSGVGRHVAC